MNRYTLRITACLLSVLLFAAGCEPEAPPPQQAGTADTTATASGPMERLPENRAGEVVRRAIEEMGGWATWADKRTVAYRKTTLQLGENGEVERRLVQTHQYALHPGPKLRIAWDEDGHRSLLVNNGEQAWKWVDGERAAAQEDQNQAWNSTFGSHYVFAMPFKLTDPGARLTYAGQDTLSDGTVADKVRANYDSTAGSAGGMHTWTYYFDAEDGRLVANHLRYGPEPEDYDFTEYADYQDLAGLRLPTHRISYHSNAQAEKLRKTSEYLHEDIRFNAPLPDSLFALPQ